MVTHTHAVAARSVAIAIGAALLVSGCGQHSSRALPNVAQQPPQHTVPFSIQVTVPTSLATSSLRRSPAYVSAQTQSMTVWVASVAHPETNTPPQSVETVTANLTPASPNCTTTSAGTNCMIPLHLAPGSYWANVETFAQQNGTGYVLSIQHWVPFTVPQGSPDGSPAVIPWVLYGVPHSIQMTPTTTAWTRVTGSSEVTGYTNNPVRYGLTALDASGAQIVGAGAPVWTMSSTNASFTVTPPTQAAPNTISVTPPATTTPLSTQLTVQANFPDDASKPNGTNSSGVCRAVGAVCSASGTLKRLDVSHDDWITFAHDYQRTGYQRQATGLSKTSAAQLALRWKIQVPNGAAINANPAVYKGNVIVVTSSPAVVYDFAAVDGSLIWSRPIGAGSSKPATIDPTAGLVFVGNRLGDAQGQPGPSTLYALNLADGSIAWQQTLSGMTRSAEVVADGPHGRTIFIGTAGGDPPKCMNAGVQALDESTGAIRWSWYVNSAGLGSNPGGGGSVWGAIGFDGSRLIFGTGNVCTQNVPTADGAAALDLNGNLLWGYVAWAQIDPNFINRDYDTGSSVLIQSPGSGSETATFLNKNATMYTFSTLHLADPNPSAVLQRKIAVNPNAGYGFFASPTSDGSTVVVGTGEYPDTSSSSLTRSVSAKGRVTPDMFTPQGTRRPSRHVPGYHSMLAAFDASGHELWTYTTQDILSGYAAIANGVVVSAADSSVVALDLQSGQKYWSYPTASIVDNSPAVVPSGIYIADNGGNVYAFAPPYTATSP